jgi:hypothetical protein
MAPYPQFTRAIDLAFAMARFPPVLNMGSKGGFVKKFFDIFSLLSIIWNAVFGAIGEEDIERESSQILISSRLKRIPPPGSRLWGMDRPSTRAYIQLGDT